MDYNTKKLLGLTDCNITFSQDWLSERKFRGNIAHVITGKLTYRPLCCEKCGELNNGQIISNGTVQTSTQLPPFNYQVAFLQLFRTRFLCYSCGATFVAQTPIVERNHHISNALKYQIALDLRKIRSRRDIAEDYSVSDVTITRIQREFASNYRPNLNYLPQTLCIDEFKSMKSCSGAMSFICVDGDSGKLLEIIEDRRLSKLVSHFLRFSRQARLRVKYLVMDMNASYAQLIQTVFPNAEIVTDRFHIVQHINRSFNQLRIKIMNSLRNSNTSDQKKYRRLKRFWKLLLMDSNRLDLSNRPYVSLFKRPLCQRDIVVELLTYDQTLRLAYHTVQALKLYIRERNSELFFKLIRGLDNNLPQWFRSKFNDFNKYKDGVNNALLLPYSNGRTEGLNNKIKVIKRVSFGYRNFYHLRDRIYLIQGLVFS